MAFSRAAGLSILRVVAGLAGVLFLAAILVLTAGSGGAQGQPQPSAGASAANAPAAHASTPHASASPALSVPNASAVLSLLDAIIGWCRGIDSEQQLVEEPSEVLFVSRDRARTADVLKVAFEYARAEANLLASLKPAEKAPEKPAAALTAADLLAHPEFIQSRRAQVDSQIAGLERQAAQLNKQIASPRIKNRAQLTSQLALIENQIDLAHARAEFLATMAQFQSGSGALRSNRPEGALLDQIDELEKTLPQTGDNAVAPPAALGSVEVSGLIPRAKAWFALRSKIDQISERAQATTQLNTVVAKAIDALHGNLKQIDSQATALAGNSDAGAGTDTAAIEARRKQFVDLLARNKLVGGAMLPLREIALLLTRYQLNLREWQDSVRQRASAQLYGLAESAAALAMVLIFLLGVGTAWRRIAFSYIEDTRRRSQIRQLRDFVIGALIAIVIAFEFVTEVGSLATVIGLGTAGIAVALQDVILSIAGYFRIGGRFGIRVGDWVEVQGVRGEVIDIGLTKLTMMELGGEGQREPTGRLLVFPNSVVFREKFANRAYGTSLGWAELELTVAPDCDYQLAEKLLLQAVEEVFSRYRDAARSGSREMERRFNLRLEPPRPQSRLRIGSDAIRLSVRYPVDVRMQVQVTDEISRRVLESLMREPRIRLAPHAAAAILRAEPADSGAAEHADSGAAPSTATPLTVTTPPPQAAVSPAGKA
ncbi:MAG: mechanosensitive ion channel family protein [Candidatus Binatales bacterium]